MARQPSNERIDRRRRTVSDCSLSEAQFSRRRVVQGLAGIVGITGVGSSVASAADIRAGSDDVRLTEVASIPDQMPTGIAVSGDERLFVSVPRFPWSVTENDPIPDELDVTTVEASVVEVLDNGSLAPYPNAEWNADGWDQEADEWNEAEYPAAEHFINVQSVYIDPRNPCSLWALDTGNPEQSEDPAGIIEAGPKLVEIDTQADEVVRTVPFDRSITPERDRDAYLNDVRFDCDREYAFLTDSELGALVVTHLETGESRRILDDQARYPSLHAAMTPRVGVHEAQQEPYPAANTHSDGIAISPDDAYVYYHALSARRLYRIETRYLADFSLSQREIADHIEDLGETDATDGMLADGKGRIYHTALARDAISRWNPETGDTETVVQDSSRIKWPDSLTRGPDDAIYFTTSKIHLESTGTRRKPFKVFRLDPA